MWKSEFEIACQIGPKWAETVWNCDVSICQTNFALSFVYGENAVFFSVFSYEFYVPVWIERFSLNPALRFSSFFFAFTRFREETKFTVYETNVTVHALFRYCSRSIHGTYSHFIQKKILKMGPTVLFTHLKIILLQCFQFSVSAIISSIQTDF